IRTPTKPMVGTKKPISLPAWQYPLSSEADMSALDLPPSKSLPPHSSMACSSPNGEFLLLAPDKEADFATKPLVVHSMDTGKSSQLFVPGPSGPEALTVQRVFSKTDGTTSGSDSSRLSSYAEKVVFSPIGSLMALPDRDGSIHFFSLYENAKHLGSLNKDHKVGSYRINELVLAAILDDETPEHPFLYFYPKGQHSGLALLAEFALTDPKNMDVSRVVFNKANAPTNMVLAPDNRAVIFTESGLTYMLDAADGKMGLIPESRNARITDGAFSGDGTLLAMISDKGDLYLSRDKGAFSTHPTGLTGITALITDTKGTRVWLSSGSDKNDATNTLSMFDLGTQKLHQYQGTLGSIQHLVFSPERDAAIAIQIQKNLPKGSKAGFDDKLRPLFHTTQWQEGNALLFDWPYEQGFVFVSENASHAIFFSDAIEFYTRSIDSYVYSSADKKITTMVNNELVEFGYDCFMNVEGSAALSADGKVLASTAQETTRGATRLVLFSTESGSQLLQTPIDTRSMHPINSAAFLHNAPHRLLTASRDGVRLWDLKKNPLEPTTVLRWVFLSNGNHLVLDQDSRFDTPNIDKLDGVHWTAASVPGKALPLECFMRDYYQPRLAEYVLARRHLPPVTGIDEKNLYQAKVAVRKVMPEPGMPNHVSVVVEVDSAKDGTPQEVRDLKLFRDGVLVAWNKGAAGDGRLELKDGKAFVIFDKIALPGRKNAVTFTAYAFNEDKVRSNTGRLYHRYTPEDKGTSRLHLVAVGINAFTNPDWNLRFAANDAKAFSETLPRYLELGEKADVRLLAARAEPANATRERIERELARLSGVGSGLLSRDEAAISGPDDVVVITVSTHGITEKDTFYIFPADITGTGRAITPELLGKAISAEQLGEWMTPLDAREIVLILDTCESGTALGGDSFRPGPMGDKGLGQLVYDKGIRVLCATNDNSATLEADALEHGILSYVLLKEGLEEGKAALPGTKDASIRDWLRYGKTRTAELYAKIRSHGSLGLTRGKVRYEAPPIAVQKQETGESQNPGQSQNLGQALRLGQEPYLFDKEGESTLLRLQQ
ncbi:caspase family protein, partial [Desulfovibrio sp. OttesenSCG-928-G15]|nr:caspase family protein [Desulfovibrio sp. OttesenSCG-928-G15]